MRKPKTIHYIYKTTCNVTGRYYIGMHSTNNLEDGYMGSGRRLRASIRKHGEDSHTKEILSFYDNRELLVEAEIKAITPEMIGDNNCMNLMGGGDGGYISEEHYKITSKLGGEYHAKRMKNDPEYHAEVSLRLRIANDNNWADDKIRERLLNNKRFTDKSHSEETKSKMSEAKKGTGTGSTNSQYGTCWITREGENKKIKKEDLNQYIEDGWIRGRK